MATEQELRDLYQEAKASGRTDIMEKVVTKLETMQKGEMSIANVARSAGQGLTFGFGDEITAGVRSVFSDDTYDDAVADERAKLAAFREQHPKTAYGTEIGTSLLVPGGVLGAVPRGAMTAGRAAKMGAIGGGLYGLGASEEETPLGMAIDTSTGAAAGGLAGVAFQGATRGGEKLLSKLKGVKDPQFERVAAREVAKAIRRDDDSVANLTKRLAEGADLGPTGQVSTVADVGRGNMQGLVAGVTQRPGRARAIGEKMAEKRMAGERGRVFGQFTDDLLKGKTDADTLLTKRKATLETLADDAYKQSYTLPNGKAAMVEAGKVKPFFRHPEFQQGYERASNLKRLETGKPLPPIDDFFAPGVKRVSVEDMDWVKRGVQDLTDFAKAEGSGGLGPQTQRALKKVTGEFLDVLDDANPVYGEARKLASKGYRLDDALKEGRKITSTKSVGEFKKQYDKLPTDEQEIFRSSAMQRVSEWAKQEGISPGGKIWRDNEIKKKLSAVFPDTKSYTRFENMLSREVAHTKTNANILAGSRTAKTMKDLEGVSKGSEVIHHAAELGFSPLFGTARIFGRKADKQLAGFTEKVHKEIADMLLSNDPNKIREALRLMNIAEKQSLAGRYAYSVPRVAPAPVTGGLLVNQLEDQGVF